MKPSPQTLDQALNRLDRRLRFQLLRYIQARQGRDAVLQRAVEASLGLGTSAPVANNNHDGGEYLTVPEVAARLKLSRPRVYELCRLGRLAKIQLGKQIRIPVGALSANHNENPEK